MSNDEISYYKNNFYPSISLEGIFSDFTIISNIELKDKIENRCIAENSIAIIDKHVQLGWVWHSLITGGWIIKKDIAKLFIIPNKTNIYFMQSIHGGLVKIGQAKDVDTRLANHQCGCPVELKMIKIIENVDPSVEKSIHKLFSEFRKHGEWFDPCVLNMECGI